jgi:putative ABC transport system permease protein
MRFLPLIWKNIWRRKIRTIFTLLAILVAFLLYGILMTIRMAFTMGIDVAGVDRLMTMHKVSIIQFLPITYLKDIESTKGVRVAMHNTWFGGIYQDPKNFFPQVAVDPVQLAKVYPEYRIPDDQRRAWLADRQGAVAGVDLARRFGWKVGDRIPIRATIWQPKQGGQTWYFNLVGLYDADKGVDRTQFFFRYDYLDENRSFGEGAVSWYAFKVDDPSRSADIASAIDAQFANSSAETKTSTEKAFVQAFANQVGDIGTIMVAILTAVLFNILLIAASTMVQSVRERTSELAVLKTLGFTDTAVLAIVLVESLFIAVLGGGIGLWLAWGFVQQGDPTNGMLPIFILPPRDLILGIVLMAVLGLLAGALPATAAMRLRITDALRRQ